MSDSSEPTDPDVPAEPAAEPETDEPKSDKPETADSGESEIPAPETAEASPARSRKPLWSLVGVGIMVVAIIAVTGLILLSSGHDDEERDHDPPCTSTNPASCATTSQSGSEEPPKDPTAVARAYAAAYNRHDIDALERYVCAGDQPMIQTFRAIKEQFEKNGVTIEVTGDATETGDTASVPTTTREKTTTGTTNTTHGPLSLTRENGAWKVCNLPQGAKPTWSDTNACTLLTPSEAGRYLGGGAPSGTPDNKFDRPTCEWKAEDNYHEVRLFLWNPPVREAITGNAKRTLTIAGKPAYVRSETSGGCAIDVDAGQGFVSIDITAVGGGDQCAPAARSLATVIGRLKW